MHNRCIDTDLIVRRAYNDATLMKFLQVNICTQGLFDATLPTGAIALSNGHYFSADIKKMVVNGHFVNAQLPRISESIIPVRISVNIVMPTQTKTLLGAIMSNTYANRFVKLFQASNYGKLRRQDKKFFSFFN